MTRRREEIRKEADKNIKGIKVIQFMLNAFRKS